jgi:hypothetical protein
MCIITSTVDSVSGTQIYVSSDETYRRQITIYSNRVDTPIENAMILAVPNPSSISFINFKHYSKVFDDLASCFGYNFPARALGASATRSHSTLPVYSVGSYNASILETLNDFDRLNEEVYEVNSGLIDFLQRKYGSSGLGFIVCQLKSGNHTYHPFAYTHHQHANGQLFVPTMHYHAHSYSSKRADDDYEADWGHIVYSPATNLRTSHWDDKVFKENLVDWSKFPQEYRWAHNVEIDRWEKYGNWKNCDLFATHTSDPRKWTA